MAKKMSAEERQLDIMAFLHRNYLASGQWVTVGEYARFAKLSRSPYLTSVFSGLLDARLITMQEEPYRATVMYTFALNYEKIERFNPHIKQEMINRVGSWQERLIA